MVDDQSWKINFAPLLSIQKLFVQHKWILHVMLNNNGRSSPICVLHVSVLNPFRGCKYTYLQSGGSKAIVFWWSIGVATFCQPAMDEYPLMSKMSVWFAKCIMIRSYQYAYTLMSVLPFNGFNSIAIKEPKVVKFNDIGSTMWSLPTYVMFRSDTSTVWTCTCILFCTPKRPFSHALDYRKKFVLGTNADRCISVRTLTQRWFFFLAISKTT